MANTSGAPPPASEVWSLSQYGSQSDTSTLTVILGLAAWNASTIACWFLISWGSPQIEYEIVASGPVESPALAPGAAGAAADPEATATGEPVETDGLALDPPHAVNSRATAAIATRGRGG